LGGHYISYTIKPPRVIGLASAVLLNLNGVVGAGIFALPAILYANAGSLAPIAILAFALFLSASLAVVAKLSTLFDQSGGPQLYLHYAFGEVAGFQGGWLAVCGNMASRAANFHVMAAYLAALFPVFDPPAMRLVVIVALIALFAGLAIVGTRQAIGALWVGSALKLVPLFALCIAGLAINGAPSNVTLPNFSEIEAVALALAYAFSGGAVAAISAGETRDPGNTVGRSMYWNLAVVALFYAFIQFSYEAINPVVDDPTRALSAAGAALFGDVGVTIISLVAIVSIGTGQLNFFIAMPRVLFGMGRRGSLPQIFGFLSDRFQTPSAAIGIYSAIVTALALSGTFMVLVSLLVAADVILSLAIVAALYRVWQRNDAGIADTMGPIWIPVGLIAVGFVIWLGLQLPLSAALGTGSMMAAGMALFWLAKRAGHQGEPIHIIE